MEMESSNQMIIYIIIMIVMTFIVTYYINESISLKKNITDNGHKFYMSLLMAFQMGLIESIMMYLFYGTSQLMLYLIGFFTVATVYIGYKLKTLDFLDEKQFLLSMIEHHQGAIEMSNTLIGKTKDSELNTFMNGIVEGQNMEIDHMYNMLKKYP